MVRPSIVVAACAAALLCGAPSAYAQPGPPPGPPPDYPGDDYDRPPPPDGRYGQPPPPYRQPPPPYQQPEPAFERDGWFAGFGLHLGGLTFDGADEPYGGGGIDGYFGGMVSPRFGFLVQLIIDNYTLDEYDDSQLGLVTWALGAQLFATDRLWLRGTVGSTRFSLRSNGSTLGEDEGRSLGLAFGYELMQKTSFALDLQFAMMFTGGDSTSESSTFGLGVGFSWY